MNPARLVIGTRGSRLALAQVDLVIAALKASDPSVEIDVRVIQTHGDVNQQPIPLDAVGKGWFTKEIEQALSAGEIDLAVHSLKDMADGMPAGLAIGAYLPREDARDALITKEGRPFEALPTGAIVGTDSARRQAQMRALKPDVRMKSLRGNVTTRLEKLATEDYDAIILAAAGLKRLGLDGRVTRYFAPDEMTPAPGQGIMAVQTRADAGPLRTLLDRIDDADAARAAHIERSFSRAVGGGCKAPVGAYAEREASGWRLIAMLAGRDGRLTRGEMRASEGESEGLGPALAEELLAAAA